MPVVELKIPDLDKFIAAAEKQAEAAGKLLKAAEKFEEACNRLAFYRAEAQS